MRIKYFGINKRVIIYKENHKFVKIIFQKRKWLVFWTEDCLIFHNMVFKEIMQKVREKIKNI